MGVYPPGHEHPLVYGLLARHPMPPVVASSCWYAPPYSPAPDAPQNVAVAAIYAPARRQSLITPQLTVDRNPPGHPHDPVNALVLWQLLHGDPLTS